VGDLLLLDTKLGECDCLELSIVDGKVRIAHFPLPKNEPVEP
jgi:hypothetical protein